MPGSLQLAPLAGFIDGGSSGHLGGCTFTETADHLVLSATGPDAGKLYVNLALALEMGIGGPLDRKLTAFDRLAPMVATRTLVCPNVTIGSTGPTSHIWLHVDSDLSDAVSADLPVQNRLAATLTVNARMAVLKAKDSTDCTRTQRRSRAEPTATSAVCAATAMVNET